MIRFPFPFAPSEVEWPFGSTPTRGVSTSDLRSEVYPERLASQPVEGLDTNGDYGWA
jgi:hypothetical protein